MLIDICRCPVKSLTMFQTLSNGRKRNAENDKNSVRQVFTFPHLTVSHFRHLSSPDYPTMIEYPVHMFAATPIDNGVPKIMRTTTSLTDPVMPRDDFRLDGSTPYQAKYDGPLERLSASAVTIRHATALCQSQLSLHAYAFLSHQSLHVTRSS